MRDLSLVFAAATVISSVCAFHIPQQQVPFLRKNSVRSSPSTPLFMSDEDNGWEAPKSAMIGGAGVNNAGEPPFEIRGFSLGNLIIGLGVAITVLSFSEYLTG